MALDSASKILNFMLPIMIKGVGMKELLWEGTGGELN